MGQGHLVLDCLDMIHRDREIKRVCGLTNRDRLDKINGAILCGPNGISLLTNTITMINLR